MEQRARFARAVQVCVDKLSSPPGRAGRQYPGNFWPDPGGDGNQGRERRVLGGSPQCGDLLGRHAAIGLFNDRYYLVLLPAGCLLLALAPYRYGAMSGALSVVMLAVMGWFAAAGVYDQQRGLEAVISVRDALLHDGIARGAIDAGYPLNGSDLYRDPQPGQT